MQTIFDAMGGRKMCLILLAVLLQCIKKLIGIDEQTMLTISGLLLGGAGTIALEEGLRRTPVATTTTTTTTPPSPETPSAPTTTTTVTAQTAIIGTTPVTDSGGVPLP